MKNNKKIYDIVFILDKSGSMANLADDTVGGFNSMIQKQKSEKADDKVFVTTFLFNNKVECLHKRIPLENIEPLTGSQYVCAGNTALYDAIGSAIEYLDEEHLNLARHGKKIANEALFIISTDGMENTSKKYNLQKISQLIEKRKTQNIDFMFIGANIDTERCAKDLSIDKKMDFTTSKQGVENMFVNINSEILMLRKKMR